MKAFLNFLILSAVLCGFTVVAAQNLNRTLSDTLVGLQVKISYVVPPLSESVTIQNDSLAPDIERRNDTIYKNTLFGRDDQLIQSLAAFRFGAKE